MLSTLRDASIDDADRLFLHFAIGKLLDDLGEYREAMKPFRHGQQHQAPQRYDLIASGLMKLSTG